MSELGERVKGRRLQLNWTLEELARQAGISKGFLSDLENGKRGIGAETLLEIARALSVSLEYLMTGDTVAEGKVKEIQIPARLSDLARQEGLAFRHVLMLLEMHHQILAFRSVGKSRQDGDFDWKGFYTSVKRFLP